MLSCLVMGASFRFRLCEASKTMPPAAVQSHPIYSKNQVFGEKSRDFDAQETPEKGTDTVEHGSTIFRHAAAPTAP